MEDDELGEEGATLLGMWTTEVKRTRTEKASKVSNINHTRSFDLSALQAAAPQLDINE